VWPVTGTVALVTGATGCPAAGEAVCCPVAAPAVGSCVLPVAATPLAMVFWTVPEAELVEVVPAEVAVVAGWLVAEAEEPVPDWLAGAPEEALPDWVLFVDGWLPPDVVAPELVLLEAVPAVAVPD
jgi:hypothetical protein